MSEIGIVREFEIRGGDFAVGGEVASQLKHMLQQIGVPGASVRRMAICCYEAEMNVIIHAYHGRITATIYPDRIQIIVEDVGPGIPDIELAMQEGYSTAPDYVREMGFGAGMGLPNMARCADEFAIESQVGVGTKIKLVIRYK